MLDQYLHLADIIIFLLDHLSYHMVIEIPVRCQKAVNGSELLKGECKRAHGRRTNRPLGNRMVSVAEPATHG